PALRSRADGAGEPDRCRPRRQPADRGGSGGTPARATGTTRAGLRGDIAGGRPMTTAAPPSTWRILVVDHEIGPRESARMRLKPRSQVKTADNALDGLREIASFRPDLVILDIKMPEIDGLEALRRVKKVDATIEVVMITAYASLETVKLALSHGAFEYL